MEIHEITKEEMDSKQALAATNLKISESRSILLKLEESETEFLIKREEKAVNMVQRILESSQSVLNESYKNFKEVHDLYDQASNYAEYLQNIHISIENLISKFNETSKIWEDRVAKQEEEFEKTRKEFSIDRALIKNDKEALDKKREDLKKMSAEIESRQATLEIAYKVEKKLWESLKNK